MEISPALKEEADKLMKVKGMTKGSEFLTLARYIETKYGKEGLEKLEKKMEELTYPCHFDEIKPAHWYPEALRVLTMIVAKELFGWQDLFEFGYYSPTLSFGVKVFIKFLVPPGLCNQAPKIWKKFFDVGVLEVEATGEEKYVIIRLKNYLFHPEMCRYFAGVFLRLDEYIIKSKKITIKEIKCIYMGDPYHEYLVKWE